MGSRCSRALYIRRRRSKWYVKLTLRSESSVVDFCGHSNDENHDSNFSANSLTCPLHCTLIVTLED